jgi:glutathione peroxidase
MCCKRTIPGNLLLLIAAVGLVLGVGQFVIQANADESDEAKEAPVQTDTPAALNFEMQSIDGKDVKLDQYHGDVVLMVNVASKCGLTKQYKELQQLHEEYADKGLSILGFPANNFRKQEPGSDDEIATFCKKNYGVEFDLFSKISVAGDDQAPLYAFLTSEETNPKHAGEITWNFEKFLVNRDGEVIARFAPRTKPSAEEVIKAIEAALAQPVPDAVKAKKAESEKG